jgi:VanZ family protein
MHSRLNGVAVMSLRVLTWCCVVVLAVLSLMPAEEMVRTGLSGQFEHSIAYAGSAAIGMAGYGSSRSAVPIIGGFWLYAGILEYLQHFVPGRHPSIADFAASAVGVLCGGLAAAILRHRLLRPPQ